ncbi:helix-turn-helix domain-containing protein [Kitasatospora sp. NPDC051853]|uniref:helix-turn-helix domain-containing protein n=1 Tax=Kitasatospora sp. NPDC051853 TaxID=3364058 RepID=UPI00379E8B65
MENDDRARVLDPERDADALKALTHPLRIRLLGLLRRDGPATASELAAATGESSASASYHLRVLAKHAFVREAEHRDGRERRWQAVHALTSWDSAAMASSPGNRAVASSIRRSQLDHLANSLARFEAEAEAGLLGPEWLGADGVSDWMPRLTPDSLAELWQTLESKVTELTARDAEDPRATQVIVLAATLPLAPPAPGSPE